MPLREWMRDIAGSLGMFVSERVAMGGFKNVADLTLALRVGHHFSH